MSTSSPVIAIKTEPIGSATRVIGTVDGREVIYISNSAGGAWVVGGSSCLSTDLAEAAACLECMRRAMVRAGEHGAPVNMAKMR